jgi:hypothetical protein
MGKALAAALKSLLDHQQSAKCGHQLPSGLLGHRTQQRLPRTDGLGYSIGLTIVEKIGCPSKKKKKKITDLRYHFTKIFCVISKFNLKLK